MDGDQRSVPPRSVQRVQRSSRSARTMPEMAERQPSGPDLPSNPDARDQTFVSPPPSRSTKGSKASQPPSSPQPSVHDPPLDQQTEETQAAERDWQQRAAPPKHGISRRVKLTKGHYVVDLPVPPAIVNSVEELWRLPLNAQGKNEQTHMRYTAATCDPAEFVPANGWTLRTTSSSSRSTELMVCLTAYNEDKMMAARTIHGVMLNIRDIVKHSDSKFWRGRAEHGTRVPGWQRIVVACIFDGLDAMDKEVLDLLAILGLYQDNVMKKMVDGKETVMHLFEYTTQISMDPGEGSKPKLVVPASSGDKHADNLVPVQFILMIKQRNQKKINSHRWLMDGIGRQIEPTVCIFIDVGTRPLPWSLYYLWSAFHRNKNVAGCCGEIVVQASLWKLLTNPLVAAQNFEYKISNLLDKPLDASIGFVPVLPGAFSAYRYSALQGPPLQQYFLGDHSLADRLGSKGLHGMSLFKKNMFLAEDRLLCFELVARRGKSYTLAFIRAAKGETDVPETAIELIAQRRRWLNGSLSATLYSIVHFPKFYLTRHNPLRLLFLHIQLIYQMVVLLFTFFNLAVWWLTFSILIALLPDSSHIYLFGSPEVTWWVNTMASWVFVVLMGMQFLLALGAKPKTERAIYAMSLWLFAILGYYLLVCALVLTVNAIRALTFDTSKGVLNGIVSALESTVGVLLAALISTFGGYLIASLMYLDLGHMLHSFIQYLGLAPSLVLILQVFAFSNISDVSWGTKGADKADALPALSTKAGPGGEKVVDQLERTPDDLEERFRKTAMRAISRHKPKAEVWKPNEDESNRSFRTMLLLVWLLSNIAVVMTITYINGYDPSRSLVSHDTGQNNSQTLSTQQLQAIQSYNDEYRRRQSIFFSVILWSTFGLTAAKIIGSIYFWLRHELLRKALLACRGT